MKLTKNEAKKLAKTAKSIIIEETGCYPNGSTYTNEKTLSYDQMIETLKEASRWYADQYGNKIFVGSSIHNITVSL